MSDSEASGSETSDSANDGHRHRRPRTRHAKLPFGWEAAGDEYDYIPLRLPADVTRVSATTRLAIQAEFGGWELSRVRLYTDGSRRVLLRRSKSASALPGAEPTL